MIKISVYLGIILLVLFIKKEATSKGEASPLMLRRQVCMSLETPYQLKSFVSTTGPLYVLCA